MRLHDGQEVQLTAGVAIWARPGGQYLAQQDHDNRLSVTAIHFDTRRRPPVQEVYRFREPDYGSAVLDHVAGLWQEDHRDMAQRLFAVVLEELIAGTCTRSPHLSGTQLHHVQVVEAAAAAMRESPSETGDLETLAARHGYSLAHFSRLFRAHIGCSPRAFLVACRLSRARDLLLNTAMTVSQIADALGYSSVYFFSRQFRQHVGVAPGRYRQQATDGN